MNSVNQTGRRSSVKNVALTEQTWHRRWLPVFTGWLVIFGVNTTYSADAPSTTVAATAVNRLAIDLHRLLAAQSPNANLCLSPYSIQMAFAMTLAGAAGETREEMARVLHYPTKDEEVHPSFAALRLALTELSRRSQPQPQRAIGRGSGGDPITFHEANRLYGQKDFEFRSTFTEVVAQHYGAPFEPVDFASAAPAVTRQINVWVEEMTRQRIRDLIPPGALTRDTRLVLVNSLYLKAPWATAFTTNETRREPFYGVGNRPVEVTTMVKKESFGYAERDGYQVVTLPYIGGELQFVIFLPKAQDGLAALEAKWSAEILASSSRVPVREIILHLPKFKLEPPTLSLASSLKALGMRRAFDEPPGTADFDRMAPRKPNEYLAISDAFHKTFLALDEGGTEAAAATAVAMVRITSMPLERQPPIEVKIDHPFAFAIQHRPSGACLFVGRVAELR